MGSTRTSKENNIMKLIIKQISFFGCGLLISFVMKNYDRGNYRLMITDIVLAIICLICGITRLVIDTKEELKYDEY